MKDDLVYLRHILAAISRIEKYLSNVKFEDYLKNDLLIDGVVKQLEIIGEAAANVSEKFQRDNPQIPWLQMIGMRNRLIHGYFGINEKIVWETCQIDLPGLKKTVALVLPDSE